MNILVTGGCGFIGSNFINYILQENQQVKIVNLDKLDYCSNINNIEINQKNYNRYIFYKTDINNVDFLTHIFNHHQPSSVIHFAADSHVDNSFDTSDQYILDNVRGTNNLLLVVKNYLQHFNIPNFRFIHISTDEVYGEVHLNHDGCIENSILNPTNPYSASKAAAEMIVNSYKYSYNIPIIITRGNNVYGPRQYPEKLIPKFTCQLLQNKKMTIHGKGQTSRNFIHVDDVSKAIYTILTLGKIGEIYNIGTKNEYTVIQIAQKLIDIIKPNSTLQDWIHYVEDRPFNDTRYAISNDKLTSLGWKETTDFNKGLFNTVNWYIEELKNNSFSI